MKFKKGDRINFTPSQDKGPTRPATVHLVGRATMKGMMLIKQDTDNKTQWIPIKNGRKIWI
jgi:hypothetical protein